MKEEEEDDDDDDGDGEKKQHRNLVPLYFPMNFHPFHPPSPLFFLYNCWILKESVAPHPFPSTCIEHSQKRARERVEIGTRYICATVVYLFFFLYIYTYIEKISLLDLRGLAAGDAERRLLVKLQKTRTPLFFCICCRKKKKNEFISYALKFQIEAKKKMIIILNSFDRLMCGNAPLPY